jgi:hypothetical protein
MRHGPIGHMLRGRGCKRGRPTLPSEAPGTRNRRGEDGSAAEGRRSSFVPRSGRSARPLISAKAPLRVVGRFDSSRNSRQSGSISGHPAPRSTTPSSQSGGTWPWPQTAELDASRTLAGSRALGRRPARGERSAATLERRERPGGRVSSVVCSAHRSVPTAEQKPKTESLYLRTSRALREDAE